MTISIYADGADLAQIKDLAAYAEILGFTTNPTLARKAGVTSYIDFCKAALDAAAGKPVSLEVLADEPEEIVRQAVLLSGLGPNAVVKVPVVNTLGILMDSVIAELAKREVSLNVTAVFTIAQAARVGETLAPHWHDGQFIVSVFAGRVADAGVDVLEHVSLCREALRKRCDFAEMLWASPRQTWDLTLADRAGCDIITMTPDLISKLALRGKDLDEYSRETVQMFARDAHAAGYTL